MASAVCDHCQVTYDRTKLQKLGRRRQAALVELDQVRREVTAQLAAARKTLTWREIAADTTYTDQQLRTMALPEAEREEREEARRRRRRKPTKGGTP
jgi:hypothetical protein